ncbi:alpha/beta hydrolase family protein [Gordonia sinesedis]
MSLLRGWRAAVVAALGVLALLVTVPGVASATPSPGTSRIEKVTQDGPQQVTLTVYSASMGKSFPVQVLTPKDTTKAAPVLYLLNGAGGGEDKATWAARTEYVKYFADKNAYVVTPVGGAYSYYTDWVKDDPALGRNKWETFLTKELPPLIDAQFPTTGRNALAGISMAGTSVFNLAIAAPGLYRSIGAYSGCARTSDPAGQAYIRLVVESRGDAKVENMWGPTNGGIWREKDPFINAEKLRGTKIYMTAGNGLPGKHERLDDPSVKGDVPWLINQTVLGGIIEAAIGECTRQMTVRLAQLGIPADISRNGPGTHSWGYWQDDLYSTWPKIARDLAS